MLNLVLRLKALLVQLLELTVIVVFAALVLDVLWGVCSRFILRAPSRWTEEVAEMLLIWVALLGTAVAFHRREHLGVDYLVKKLDASAATLVAVTVQLLVMAFATAALIYGGSVLVSQSNELTPALKLDMSYVYLAVPVSGVCIVIFCIEELVNLVTGRSATGGVPPEKSVDLGEAP